MAFRPLHVETPEERLRVENAELRAELREMTANWHRAVDGRWRAIEARRRVEDRLDAWMPLGALGVVSLAVVVTAVLGWIAGWV